MSHIYLPELVELDSYWRTAVEDAIYETLKGEKRLFHALKNREKIKGKLERLGRGVTEKVTGTTSTWPSQMSIRSNGEPDRYGHCKSVSDEDWDSCEEYSGPSNNNDVGPQEVRRSFSPAASKSKSRDRKETPPEKIYKNPERPILGNGSLEKMKKSQNSFYCEPMGPEGRLLSQGQHKSDPTEGEPGLPEDNNNNVRCLHFRQPNRTTYDDSETEMSGKTCPDVGKRCPKRKYAARQPSVDGSSSNEKIPMTLDPGGDLFWEKEVKNAIRENAGQERKLHVALAKRDIVKSLTKGGKGNSEIKIRLSGTRLSAKRKHGKKFLSPFVRFYLEVYRELCHRCPVDEIGAEAAARWRQKSLKEKSKSQK